MDSDALETHSADVDAWAQSVSMHWGREFNKSRLLKTTPARFINCRMFGCAKGLANRKTNPDTLVPLSLDGTISADYFPTLKAAYATYYRRLFAYLRQNMVKYALVDVRAGKYVGLELLNLTNLTVPFEEKNTRSAPGGVACAAAGAAWGAGSPIASCAHLFYY